jgi:hypothetical protein
MSPLLRRSGLVSLLAAVAAGCGGASFGPSTPDTGCAFYGCDPDNPGLPDESGWVEVLFTFRATGLTPEHRTGYYRVIVSKAPADTVRTFLFDPDYRNPTVMLPPGPLTITFLGLVDSTLADATPLYCDSADPVRRLDLVPGPTPRVDYPLLCGSRG